MTANILLILHFILEVPMMSTEEKEQESGGHLKTGGEPLEFTDKVTGSQNINPDCGRVLDVFRPEDNLSHRNIVLVDFHCS